MLTLLRDNTITGQVMRALHQGRAGRNPEGAATAQSAILAGAFIEFVAYPTPDDAAIAGCLSSLFPAHPPTAVPPRSDAPCASFTLRSARTRGMILRRPPDQRPALLQARTAQARTGARLVLVEGSRS